MTAPQPVETSLDPVAMRAMLQATLPGGFAEGRLHIESVRVLKARRSSSLRRNPHPISLCYEVAVRQTDSDAAEAERDGGRQLFYAKMFRNGASAQCHAAINPSRLVRPRFGEPLVHLAALDMVLWALPNDPGLPQLGELLDPVRLPARLPWAALGIDPERASGVQVELLRYEPEQRATLRCTVALVGEAVPRVLYAKTFCDARGRAVDERFKHFWRCAGRDPNAPRVAQPLGYDAATQTAWQASVQGVPLMTLLAAREKPSTPKLESAEAVGASEAPQAAAAARAVPDPDRDAMALLTQVSDALAAIHAAPLPTARERPLAHWLAEVRRRLTKIERAEPAFAPRARALVQAIEAGAAVWPALPRSLIHGDFHPEQIWLHEGRVVLFDFDEFTLGDPLEDVAEFALKLGCERWTNAFVAAVALRSGSGFDLRRLRWHLAVQCLLQASRAFIFQRPDWRAELEQWLAQGEGHAAALVREGEEAATAAAAEWPAASVAAAGAAA